MMMKLICVMEKLKKQSCLMDEFISFLILTILMGEQVMTYLQVLVLLI